MSEYTLGIDIGTTGTKTIILSATRGIVAQASRGSALHSEHSGYAEADPQQWYANVKETVREVLAVSGVPGRDIAAIATTGMVPAVIPIDAAGVPLRYAILQNDARAHREVEKLAGALSHIDLTAITGSALTQQSVAPTAVWLRTHEPDVWSRTAHLVGSYDWMLMALGASAHVEQNWALESGLVTIAGLPVDDVFDQAGLSRDILAPIVRPGTQVGKLSESAAQDLGLQAGVPLVVGGADHVLSAFAAGVEHNGDWLVKLGGAGDVLVASDSTVVDPRLYLDAHPVPGLWLPNGCMATSGSLIRWFQALIGGEELLQLDAEATSRGPADVLCLPYFLGEKSPLHDPQLRGSFAGLHLGHTRADMYRSVLEAIAFGFRHHADVFRSIGISLERVMITNGGSKSTLWKQIHSEVLGTEMYPVVDHPGASLGAALIAAVGVGVLDDWSDIRRFIVLDNAVQPDATNVAIYEEAYQEWLALGEAMRPISHRISRRTSA